MFYNRDIIFKRYKPNGLFDADIETVTINDDIEYLKISKNQNEEFDYVELIIETNFDEPFNKYDRVSIDSDYFDWYVDDDISTLVNRADGRYRHQIKCVELTSKLALYPVSTLSFDNLKNLRLYDNMFDIFKRIYRLTPFEAENFIRQTRPTYSTNGYQPSAATDEELRLSYGLTEKAYNLLVTHKRPREWKMSGKNLLEVYRDVFGVLGGTPRVVANADGDAMLDISLYNETKEVIDMSEYAGVKYSNSTKYYANNIEINADNIVDERAAYTAGLQYGKVYTVDNYILSETDGKIEFDIPIYRLTQAEMSPIVVDDWKDITDYISSNEEFTFLENGTGTTPTTRNSLKYTLGETYINGFGKQTTSDGELTTYTVWDELAKAVGFNTTTYPNLEDYRFRISFIPLIKNNRFNIKTLNPGRISKNASMRINNGDRYNEFELLVKNSRNVLDRVDGYRVEKTFDHTSIDEVFELGQQDKDTGLFILQSIVEYQNNEISATYITGNIKNIVSDLVGVNTENKFTDTSNFIRRNETVDEYARWSVEKPLSSNLNSSTFLTSYGKNLLMEDLYTLITSTQRVDRWFRFSPFGSIDNNKFILPSVSITGNGVLGFRTPIENPLRIGKRVVQETIDIGNGTQQTGLVNLTTGYTEQDGTLEKLAVSFGTQFEDLTGTDSAKIDAIRRLPILPSGLINQDGLNTFAETGGIGESTSNDYDNTQKSYTHLIGANIDILTLDGTEAEQNPWSLFGANGFRIAGLLNSHIRTDKVNPIEIELNPLSTEDIDLFGLELKLDFTILDKNLRGKVDEVSDFSITGIKPFIQLFDENDVLVKTYDIGFVTPDSDLIFNGVNAPNDSTLIYNYTYRTENIQTLGRKIAKIKYSFQLVFSAYINNSPFGISPTDFVFRVQPQVTSFDDTANTNEQVDTVYGNTIVAGNPTTDFVVDKNFNETITIDYLLHHIADRELDNRLVIGDALTERSQVLNPIAGVEDLKTELDFDAISIYIKDDNYDLNKTGSLSNDDVGTYAYNFTNAYVTMLGTSPNEYIEIDYTVATPQFSGAFAVIGSRLEDGELIHYMLWAFNRTPLEIFNNSNNSVTKNYISFEHLNPDVIYKY